MKKYTLDTLTGNIIEHSGFHPEENRSVSLSVTNTDYATVRKFSDIFSVSCFQNENEVIPNTIVIQDNNIKISFSEISNYDVIVNFYFEDSSVDIIQLSNTPTVTPSVSITPTVTPSVTPSLTPTPSVSITPSVTTTPSESVTPSISITPTVTPSITVSTSPSFVGVLDSYTSDLWAARWTKKLLSSYNGPLIRVMRLNDLAEQDFYGVLPNGSIDINEISTFCGANVGLVVRMYDQTGNNRDYVAVTGQKDKTPRIWDGNNYVSIFGLPALNLHTNEAVLRESVTFNPSVGEIFSAIKTNSTACGCQAFFRYGSSEQASHYPWGDGSIYDTFGINGRSNFLPNIAVNTDHIYNAMTNPYKVYLDNYLRTSSADAASWRANPDNNTGQTLGSITGQGAPGATLGSVLYTAQNVDRAGIVSQLSIYTPEIITSSAWDVNYAGYALSFSESNYRVTGRSTGTSARIKSAIDISTPTYFSIEVSATPGFTIGVGLINRTWFNFVDGNWVGDNSGGSVGLWLSNGDVYFNGNIVGNYIVGESLSEIIEIAVNPITRKVWMRKNGQAWFTGNPELDIDPIAALPNTGQPIYATCTIYLSANQSTESAKLHPYNEITGVTPIGFQRGIY